jgi:hypothetical protein
MKPPNSAPRTNSNDPACTSRSYAWAVFALTFGLMLSDYLSRQVIGAVMPVLKVEWVLLDSPADFPPIPCRDSGRYRTSP